MALYIMLSKLTTEGRKTMMNNPRRLFEVNKEVEKMGAKVLAQYSVLGDYDFINIMEAPNNEVIARVSSALGSRGTIEPLTLAAMSIQDYVREMETAKIIDK
ncbi:MAG: GYD domain-containing protein [Dehalococcoidales bacterium]|nr:GYD domain-containing protein [Dehalococcoidales bacterium]